MRALPLLVVSVASASCAPQPAASAAPPPSQVALAPSPSAANGRRDAGDGVELGVEEAAGMAREEVARMLVPAKTRLRRCFPGSGGKLNVRLTSENRALRVHIEPGASLDPTARECILDALSTIQLQETGGNAALPRPSGFTSLISISW